MTACFILRLCSFVQIFLLQSQFQLVFPQNALFVIIVHLPENSKEQWVVLLLLGEEFCHFVLPLRQAPRSGNQPVRVLATFGVIFIRF